MAAETFSEGETIELDFAFTEANDAPMNLTGAGVEWCIAAAYNSVAPPIFTATLLSGIALVGLATAGTVKVTIHPNHVGRVAVIPGKYIHLIRVIHLGGRTVEPWGGPLVVTESPFL